MNGTDTYWKQVREKEKAYYEVLANPLFNDKYDAGGNEISVNDMVSSTYTYRYDSGKVVPIEGKVVSISCDGVGVALTGFPLNKPIVVAGGCLKVRGKEEINAASSVWRMQNVFGEGPYHWERELSPGEQPGEFGSILYKSGFEDVWEDNLNLFFRLEPSKDTSIGIKLFGWLEGEPINKYERYAYNVETSEMRFGFLSEAQANAWFPEATREALGRFGYSLVEVQAARVIAKSGHQCVYFPA
jgi:hypothetical protein